MAKKEKVETRLHDLITRRPDPVDASCVWQNLGAETPLTASDRARLSQLLEQLSTLQLHQCLFEEGNFDSLSEQSEKKNTLRSLAATSVDDLVGLLLADVDAVLQHSKLLNHVQEIWLSQWVEIGKIAEQILAQLSPQEHPAVLSNLQLLIQTGQTARVHLVLTNFRLAVHWAKKYRDYGVEFEDLIQECVIGLLKGADKFDWRLGNRFSTYASWWVREAATRTLNNHGRTIRVASQHGSKLSRYSRAHSLLSQQLFRQPTSDEIADHLGISTAEVEDLKQIANMQPVSIDQRLSDSRNSDQLGDLIHDQTASAPEDDATFNVFLERLNVLSTNGYLTEREQVILIRRFLEGETLEKVGAELRLSSERISQLEKLLIEKLRTQFSDFEW